MLEKYLEKLRKEEREAKLIRRVKAHSMRNAKKKASQQEDWSLKEKVTPVK